MLVWMNDIINKNICQKYKDRFKKDIIYHLFFKKESQRINSFSHQYLFLQKAGKRLEKQ